VYREIEATASKNLLLRQPRHNNAIKTLFPTAIWLHCNQNQSKSNYNFYFNVLTQKLEEPVTELDQGT
jgi:hypothetical protein